MIAHAVRVTGTSHLHARRHDVGDVDRGVNDRGGGDAAGPVHDERRRDAALVHPRLVAAKRGVGCIRPRQVVGHEGVGRPRLEVRQVADVHRSTVDGRHVVAMRRRRVRVLLEEFGTATVVGQEEDQRVVEGVAPRKRCDDAADRLVHAVDLGGIDGHAQRLPVRIAALVKGPRLGVARTDRPAAVDEPGIALGFVPGRPDGVPAATVDVGITGDVLLPGMQRPMRCRERDVAEERRPGVERSFDPRDRVLADGVGVVEVRGRGTDEGLAVHQRVGIPERTGTVQRAVEVVEAALRRRRPTRLARSPRVGALGVVGVAHMPLAR